MLADCSNHVEAIKTALSSLADGPSLSAPLGVTVASQTRWPADIIMRKEFADGPRPCTDRDIELLVMIFYS